MADVCDSKLLGGDIYQNLSNYNLSRDEPIEGISKTYLHTDPRMWFDLHVDVEIGIQVRGRSERRMDEHVRIVGPGDVWFVGIFERHGYRVIETPCEVVVLIASPAMLADLVLPEAPNHNWLSVFSTPPEIRPQTPPALRPVMLDLAWRMQRSLAMAAPESLILNRLQLIELLMLFMSWDVSPKMNPATMRDDPARIAPALELALQSRQLVSHDEAAAACGLSRHQFRRAFESILGLPFAKFALRSRVQGAAADLANTDLPTKAIAAAWGFTDESHLHHAFTREFNCGPRDYRRQHRPTAA